MIIAVAAAVVLALAALGFAWQARRDAARALLSAHTHRKPLPRVPEEPREERRERDSGPPPGQADRRRHAAPEGVRARRSDRDDPGWQTAPPADDTPTAEQPAAEPGTTLIPRLPRPGQIGQQR